MSRPAPPAAEAAGDLQQQLLESSRRFELALAAARLGDWSWDAPTDVVTLGARGSDIFGLPRGQTITWTAMRELLHPDDRERARLAVEASIASGCDYDIQYRVRRPSGEEAWIAARGQPRYAADGRLVGMIGLVQDISAARRAEQALRDSEQRIRATFSQAAVGIAIAGMDGRFLDVNPRFCSMLGYTPEALRGVSFHQITHPDDRDATAHNVSTLTSGARQSYAMEKRYVRRDASVFWSRTTVTVVRDDAGQALQFIGVIDDITERKRIEEQLRRSEEALREETRILELLKEAGQKVASQLDLQAILQAVTDSATALSGARFGAFFHNVVDEAGASYMLYTLSGAPREAFERFGQPRATPVFAPTFRGEGIVRRDDITADPLYGHWSPHHGMPKGHLPVRSYLAVPVTSRSGEVLGGLFMGHPEPGVFTERAERLVAGLAAPAAVAIDNARLYEAARRSAREREQLLESERAARAAVERLSATKDEFLATLSHELRTPLSAIVGWSQLLRRPGVSAEDMQRGAEVIERNARVQAQLIEDLLDVSRITSGKVRLDVQQVLPVSFVEAAVESLRPAAEAKGVRLEVLLDPLAGPVSGDPGRLQQVVWNLLSNAVKFTPRDGKVQVRLERVNSHVEITVADTGAGIDPAFIDHVFERFRQADASTTRRHGGLGLGLSIVKHLVELHGGTVSAISPGLGAGATFRVNLPVTVVHPAPGSERRLHPRAPGAPEPGPHPDLAGIRVLIVDDDADGRELVARVLGECGAQVLCAGGAEEAQAAVQAHEPHVLVSDIGMPVVDGYELLRRVRAQGGRAARMPAIALTAFARSEDRTRALRAGFLAHLAKPVEPAELAATVASVVGRTGAAP